MSNPTFKPSEGKREEFRKYLEKNGVMDALTKVLVNLYEEPDKPEDALEYIRDRLAMQAGIETYAQMKSKCDEFQTKIDSLTHDIEELKGGAALEGEGGAPVEEAPQEAAEAPPTEQSPDAEADAAPADEAAADADAPQ